MAVENEIETVIQIYFSALLSLALIKDLVEN